MTYSTHSFFKEIKHHPNLSKYCRLDKTTLPRAYEGKNKIQAILLGADPTNDGISRDKGLKDLEYAFGINSVFEKYFFNPHLMNLKKLYLSKDDVYIQNL